MKIYIPDRIQAKLKSLPEGTVLLGTCSYDYEVASVTGVCLPGEESSLKARHKLAVIGKRGEHVFDIYRSGDGLRIDRGGKPAEVVVYRSDEFFKRTPFNPEIMTHMAKERILIIGTGSVGAPMGLELARTGVGAVIAVDKDILEIHNCMRHVLGSAYVGWPKPAAFKHYMEEHVPTCECIPVYENLFERPRARLRQVIEETRPTRILAVTDSLKIQYHCQRAALYHQLPIMAVWCDNNAVEGEIFLWEPGQARGWKPGRPERGCYACMRNPDEVTITRSSNFDYSSDDPDSYGGEPALGTFINRVNNIATIIMTAWMLRDCKVKTKIAGILDENYEGRGLQYVRLGGPYPFEVEGQITAKAPWAVEWYRVLKRENCSFCGDLENAGEVLYPEKTDDESVPDKFDKYDKLPVTGG